MMKLYSSMPATAVALIQTIMVETKIEISFARSWGVV